MRGIRVSFHSGKWVLSPRRVDRESRDPVSHSLPLHSKRLMRQCHLVGFGAAAHHETRVHRRLGANALDPSRLVRCVRPSIGRASPGEFGFLFGFLGEEGFSKSLWEWEGWKGSVVEGEREPRIGADSEIRERVPP